jgi:hypothetical protein
VHDKLDFDRDTFSLLDRPRQGDHKGRLVIRPKVEGHFFKFEIRNSNFKIRVSRSGFFRILSFRILFRISGFGFRNPDLLHVAGMAVEIDSLAGRHAQELENLGHFANFLRRQLVMRMGIEHQFRGDLLVPVVPGDSFADVSFVLIDA